MEVYQDRELLKIAIYLMKFISKSFYFDLNGRFFWPAGGLNLEP